MHTVTRQFNAFQGHQVRLSLFGFVAALCVFGGSSRPDVLAQPIIRTAAWICLIIVAMAGSREQFRRSTPLWLFLAAFAALAAAHLFPLPPEVWLQLPGRGMFREATAASQSAASWRPLAIVPSAALSALGSLIVPVVTLAYATAHGHVRNELLLNAVLVIIVASLTLGLVQFAGVPVHAPFLRETDAVSGTFANHNHFALLMAIGIVVAPAWAFWRARSAAWRPPFAAALVLLFVLAILASGSRAGMLLGLLALGCSAIMLRKRVLEATRGYSKKALLGSGVALVVALAGLIALTFQADRAVSITRALTIDPEQDLRTRALPVMLDMVGKYLPFGSGLGGFDPVYRIYEPFHLLDLLNFNHAHNDYLEIALDAGLPGIILIVVVVTWWAVQSVSAWRGRPVGDALLPKLGSVVLLLILLASSVDYPARTPVIMAVITIAAVWLSDPTRRRRERNALYRLMRHTYRDAHKQDEGQCS